MIDGFREKGTLDELGLGTVRDALADRFFPGTSTIMTRARYFLIVPWLFRELEAKSTPASRMPRRSRKMELNLIEAIRQSEDRKGNIGQRAGQNLKRLPSDVYWAGLGTWGIRSFQGSRRDYFDLADRRRVRTHQHAIRGEARDDEHDDRHSGPWHGGLPDAAPDFPSVCSLALRRVEAEYLRDRIITGRRTRASLLAELTQRQRPHGDAPFVWFHPDFDNLPERHRIELMHARCFSELMHGAALLYNVMLAERCGDAFSEYALDHRSQFQEWTESLAADAPALRAWDRLEFWNLIREMNPRVSPRTRDFCEQWILLALGADAGRLADSRGARRLIETRETQLKGALARLTNATARQRWNGASATAQLDFRWGITRTLLDDIAEGLKRKD